MSIGDAGALAWQAGKVLQVSAVPAGMIDRLGAGDALAAGVIHGWLDGDLARGLRMGALLAALALSQHGDIVVTTPDEVAELLAHGSGIIVR
jgi:2-dehydro-3-deoxygluconokinase